MTIWLGLRARGGQCARGLRAGTPISSAMDDRGNGTYCESDRAWRRSVEVQQYRTRTGLWKRASCDYLAHGLNSPQEAQNYARYGHLSKTREKVAHEIQE